MQPSQLPYSIQIVQALGPTFVAIVVGLVAGFLTYRQWRTGQTKLRLDLFNERFKILEVIDEINRAWRDARGDEWVAEYLSRNEGGDWTPHRFRLLFPKAIVAQIDGIIER